MFPNAKRAELTDAAGTIKIEERDGQAGNVKPRIEHQQMCSKTKQNEPGTLSNMNEM